MRIHALTALAALALAAPAVARAQEPGALPRDLAERIAEVLNDPATERHEGVTSVEAGRTVASDLAVLEGDLQLAGRVDGNVVVVNGNLQLADGAEVGGDVIVVGGEIAGEQEASVTGDMVVFDEPVSHCRREGRVDFSGGCNPFALDAAPSAGASAAADAGARDDDEGVQKRGTAEFIFSPGRSYNRVEGLPIHLGTALETGGSNPLRVRAMGILRTAQQESSMGADTWGYDVRVEQFIGGYQAVRVGARAFSMVDPIEGWHLTDLENSLSTFVLHRDFRDHYLREGWSAYAVVTPTGSPVTVTGELLWEDHRSVSPASPWALLRNDNAWRMQPLVAEGPLRALVGSAVLDSRSEAWDPSSGWYVRAELEHTLGSDLIRPTYVSTNTDAPFVVPSNRFGEYTRGLLDLRRYNRISPSQRLNLRIAVGGSMSVFPLPPQRQHALGGAGTLPGYGLFSLDCGARLYSGTRTVGRDGTRFFNGYGCDRFALFQAEYRGDVSFRLPLGGSARADEGEGEEDGGGAWAEVRVLDADLNWVFFVDAGAGWTSLDDHHDEAAAVDVGAGILLGDLGVYVATPVHDVYGRGGLNFFIRLAPRF
jgi:cytoskeletal protein CcmA (bactofilin family)